MKQSYRYVIYLLIGAMIYYVTGANKDPEVLNEFRAYAPALIIGLVVALMIVKYIRGKKEGDNQE